MANNRILDCTGLTCPQPVLKTKEALAEMEVGDGLLVIVDNEGSCTNVRRFAESQGHEASFSRQGSDFHVRISKGNADAARPEPEIVCEQFRPAGKIVVHVNSDTMGRGDEGLGQVLIKAYFETLLHLAKDISHITLVNSGVKLAVVGSGVLDHLEELAAMGVEVLSCGTCLKHFGLTEQLAVGQVSNMYSILEAQVGARRVLSP